MNQRIRAELSKRLRSGLIAQGKGSLRHDDKYCCLGVLCLMHSEETGTYWEKGSPYCGELTLPPVVVSRWAGLSQDSMGEMACDNDDGVDFPTIANRLDSGRLGGAL